MDAQTDSLKVLPTVDQYDTPERYAARWIGRVISQSGVEAPERDKAGEHDELLRSIYDSYNSGGHTAAAKVWQAVSKLMPSLAAMVREPNNDIIHANELIHLPPPTYLIDEYPLYESGLNGIVGESGSGKSFLAMDIGAKVAQQKAVVYIVGEGLYGYAGRWEAWKQHHNSNADLWFYPRELDFSDLNALAAFVDLVQDKQPGLVIIDTVARCMGDLDENSTRDMNIFVLRTSYLRQHLGAGVLFVHHTGKNGVMRGSSALYGAADGILFVRKTEETISIFNDRDRGGKNKDAKPWEALHRHMLPVQVELDGGEYLESVVLVPAQQIDYDLEDEDLLTEKQRAIVDAIEDMGGNCSPQQLSEITSIPSSTIYYHIKQLIKKEIIKNEGGTYSLF